MLRIALKGVLARKARLVLTALAVVLGTAFLTGTTVFTDTIRSTFDGLFTNVFANVDAYVRSSNVIEQDFGPEERGKIPGSLLEPVLAVRGVKAAELSVQGYALIFGKDGKPLGRDGNGPPTFGGTMGSEAIGFWHVEVGRAPSGPSEVALDNKAFAAGKFAIGDSVRITAARGTRTFTLVGSARFSTAGSPGGATFAMLDRKSTRLNSSHSQQSRMPSSA